MDDDPAHGDPRSFKINFQFDHNDYFENEALEKVFWHRRSKDGWTGLVSEPVKVKWKKNMDTTEGLLDLAVDASNEDSNGSGKGKAGQGGNKGNMKSSRYLGEVNTRLMGRLEELDPSSLSFFAFFGYRGRSITAEESAKATEDQLKDSEGVSTTNILETEQGAREEDLTSIIKRIISADEIHEIYPAGEELAIAISEDLFPGALRYFGKSAMVPKFQTAHTSVAQASEPEIESDDEDFGEMNDDVSEDSITAEERPKKRKK